MIFTTLRARCVCCDHRYEEFDTDDRCHAASGCQASKFNPLLDISIIPDFKVPEGKNETYRALSNERPTSKHVPSLNGSHGHFDIFALQKPIDAKPVPLAIRDVDAPLAEHMTRLELLMPYSKDILHDKYGLTCGNSYFRSCPGLFNYRQFFVLDMSGYNLSGTLKDPRSWAIMNLALEKGIRHLAVWTAGNAGYSLARLAYRVNSLLPEDQRIQVYALKDGHLDPWLIKELDRVLVPTYSVPTAHFKGEVQAVLSEEAIWTEISDDVPSLPVEQRWHVTNGCDGVGVLMYYLLALQVLQRADDLHHIIVPLGTGDLFIGFLLALRDEFASRPTKRPKLYAAVPVGGTFFEGSPAGEKPIAGKLDTKFSALKATLKWLRSEKHEFEVLFVDLPTQREARDHLSHKRARGIVCEPSALIAFAAAHQLCGELMSSAADGISPAPIDDSVLVVNTGSGVMPPGEYAWLLSDE